MNESISNAPTALLAHPQPPLHELQWFVILCVTSAEHQIHIKHMKAAVALRWAWCPESHLHGRYSSDMSPHPHITHRSSFMVTNWFAHHPPHSSAVSHAACLSTTWRTLQVVCNVPTGENIWALQVLGYRPLVFFLSTYCTVSSRCTLLPHGEV